MSARGHCLLLTVFAILGMAFLAPSADALRPAAVTVYETAEPYGYGGSIRYWLPSEVEIANKELLSSENTVTFENKSPNTLVKHGVVWLPGPETPEAPSCPGVPIDEGRAGEWHGTCTFTHPGVYAFHCYVHPTEMTGKIVVVGVPSAHTAVATEIAQRQAVLNGIVDPQGEPTSFHFEYGTKNVLEHTTAVQSAGTSFSQHDVSATLPGLSPNTEYHVELVAEYGTTTVSGTEEVSFTTTKVTKPSAATGLATSVGTAGATINGALSPEGLETGYHFEYGLDSNYGSLTPTQHLGPEGVNQATFAELTGLAPETVYHYRLVAENELGPAEGEDHTFTTSAPAPPTPAPSPSPQPSTPPAATGPPAVSSTTPLVATPPPTSNGGVVFGSPLLASSLKLAAPRHSSTVSLSVQVGQAGAGGRLQVELLAKSALLAKVRGGSGAKSVTVGRLVRQSVSAGKLSLSVPLTARGKHALALRRSLPVVAKIALKPATGVVQTIVRNITLRA